MPVARVPGRSCRGTFYGFEGGQTPGLNALTREGHCHGGKQQGFKALRPNACGHSALSKLPRNILRVWGRANGRLERRNKRGPWMQKAGYKALRLNACGHSALSKLPRTVLGVWRPGNGTGSTPAVVPGAAPALRAPAFRLFSHPFETRFSFVSIVSLR